MLSLGGANQPMKTPFFEHHNGSSSKGTSEIQKRQMLSFNSNPNISVLQIDSDFDFCQKIVKKMLTENTNYFAAELFMLLRSGHAFLSLRKIFPSYIYKG